MCHGPINFDPDKLFSLQFNPLDRRYNLAHFSDSDRDENVSPESFNCKYYIEDEFNESLANNVRNENYLSFLQRNICSLAGNFDRLLLLLANVHLQFSCIGISETWLQNSLHNCDIPGYNFVHSPRLHKAGGGVCIYVTKELEFKMRDDFALSESLFIEVI